MLVKYQTSPDNESMLFSQVFLQPNGSVAYNWSSDWPRVCLPASCLQTCYVQMQTSCKWLSYIRETSATPPHPPSPKTLRQALTSQQGTFCCQGPARPQGQYDQCMTEWFAIPFQWFADPLWMVDVSDRRSHHPITGKTAIQIINILVQRDNDTVHSVYLHKGPLQTTEHRHVALH